MAIIEHSTPGMPPQTALMKASGVIDSESFQNATSLRWAIEQSRPRTASWPMLEATVTRQPRPAISRVLRAPSKARKQGGSSPVHISAG